MFSGLHHLVEPRTKYLLGIRVIVAAELGDETLGPELAVAPRLGASAALIAEAESELVADERGGSVGVIAADGGGGRR